MAHPIEKVSNQQVFDMLVARGFQFPPGFDLSGAQNSKFRQRIVAHLAATNQPFEGIVDQAIFGAKELVLIDQKTDWPTDEKFLRTLKAYGINDDQISQIYEEAKKQSQGQGIREGGKEVADVAWQNATRQLLGDTPIVAEASRRAGLAPMAPAPAPPVPSAPGPVGGPRMQITGPATAGNPSLAGATPGAAGAGVGGGGGGASGTPVAKPLTPDQIKADIQSRYGWGAALMDIPEVAKILNDAANGVISPEEANRRWLGSDYYRSTSTNQRQWKTLLGTNPGDAREQLRLQTESIMAKARTQGFEIDPARAAQIAEVSKSNGWSDQQVNAALASEIKWDPDGAKTGVMATLKSAVQNQLVPMSDQAMTQWAQAVVSGAKTVDDFSAYLKDQAKSLFPTMAQYLDSTPGGTVKTYLDPYAQTIAKTLGTNPGDIDWMDPKWYRFVNQIDPKTGERGIANIADVQRTIVSDNQYGYDQTTNGKQAKANLAKTILSDWGFLAGDQGSFA